MVAGSQPAVTGQRVTSDTDLALQERYSVELQQQLSDLGLFLRGQFDHIAGQRVSTEDRWLEDYRQYKGMYDAGEWARLKEDKFRSKLFSRMTRRKVKAFDSRMAEMLFPAGKDRNWSLKPTPEPDVVMTPVTRELLVRRQQQLFQQQAQQLAQQQGLAPEEVARKLQQGGFVPELSPDELRQIAISVSRASCDRMSQVIADQMAELKYKHCCKQVLHSGHLYGTGLLKAPLAQKKMRPLWQFDPQSQQWGMVMQPKLLPYIEFVPVWAWYPDPAARCLESLEYCYQRHVMLKSQVADLARRPNFNIQLIEQYLREFPAGDADEQSWETQIDADDDRNDTQDERTSRRYEVLEYWGVLNDSYLRDIGLDQGPMETVWVNVWMLGHFAIRYGAAPIRGMNHPYHAYYFDQDETSIWGEGVPRVIRDDQKALNGTMRAMMDNMASTVGPQYEVNTDALHPGERTRETYPGRIWYRRGDGRYPALRSIDVPSRLQEFLAVKGTFENQIHENTLPAYMQGQQTGGAGRTATGLSMLMGSANLDVKDQISNFDLGITRPCVRGFYLWNMQFSEDVYIKGDYEVMARGSSSLVAKELRATQLDQLLPLLSNPAYARYVDNRKLLEEIFKVRDLVDTEILLSPSDYEEREALRQQITQMQQQLGAGANLVQMLWKIAPNLVRQAMDRLGPEAMLLKPQSGQPGASG